MKELFLRWAAQPHVIVLVTAMVVVGGFVLASYLYARRQRVTARVDVAAPQVTAAPTPVALAAQVGNFPDGEVAHLADRVREVSALVMGLTLLAVQEAVAGREAASSEVLTERLIARELLPPTIHAASVRGVLESDTALLYVRYRVAPLAVEVVSIGRTTADGAPIIGRVVTGADEQASLFIARQSTGAALPDPFLPAAQVLALNWSAEPWRERAFDPQEVEQLTNVLRSVQPKP